MPDELRKKAEELLHWNPEDTPVLSTADVQKLFHELDVHQIELQMQNEELRTVQAELAHSRDVYLELYDFAPVGYLKLDPEGRITEANFKAAPWLGLDRGKLLVGHAFSGFVHRDSLERWNRHSRHLSEHLEKHGIDPDRSHLRLAGARIGQKVADQFRQPADFRASTGERFASTSTVIR